MENQRDVLEQLNDFLNRRGVKIRISVNTLYNFRGGSRLLSQRQVQMLREFMTNYDQKLGVSTNGLQDDCLN